jgi:hypothetical protein
VALTRPMEYIRGALIFLPLLRWIATELSGDFSMRTTSSLKRKVTPMLRI